MARKVSTSRFVGEMLRNSYYQFFLHFWDLIAAEKLSDNWHIQTLCDELQTIAERVFLDKPKDYDEIINCPPGTSKSSIVSVLWQPWIWTRMPSARFISGSYSERLALDHSRKSRDVVMSERYQELFPEIVLRDDQNTKGYFTNSKGGMRFATGVGGSVTGLHGHFIVVDDPLDPIGALSDLIIKEANVWITETLSDRKVNKQLTPTVMIMQRLHQDDPSGHWLERGGRIRHICLPADVEWPISPPEWRVFYQNGLLDRARLSRDVLDEAAKRGEEYYAGQYGQCLIAGTMIETLHGQVPIEQVKVGDFVATRQGWKEVQWSGQTKTITETTSVLFANGSVLTGTPGHPVWEQMFGTFVPLDALSGADYNRVFDPTYCSEDGLKWADQDYQAQKQLCLTASSTHGAGVSVISEKDGGTRKPERKNKKGFIELFGNTIVVTSPMVSISTIRTKTQVTIKLRILNASLMQSMVEGTVETTQSVCSFLIKSVHSVHSGIALPQEKTIIEDMVECFSKSYGRRPRTSFTLVLPVDVSLNQEQPILYQNTVLASAKRNVELEFIPKSAFDAVSHSQQATLTHDVVQNPVQQGIDGIPVFDLTIKDAHEFYANGILVHNSPIPRGGALFKVDRLQKSKSVPQEWKRGPVRFWDKAATRLGTGSYTCGTKMALDKTDRFWILDVVRFRLDSGAREEEIRRVAKLDSKLVRIGIEQEPGGGGKESAENAAKRYSMDGYRVLVDPVRGSKAARAGAETPARADSFSVQVNTGNVTLLEGPWNRDFIEEMRFFPMSRYNDQVDSSSGAFAMLTKNRLKVGALR